MDESWGGVRNGVEQKDKSWAFKGVFRLGLYTIFKIQWEEMKSVK